MRPKVAQQPWCCLPRPRGSVSTNGVDSVRSVVSAIGIGAFNAEATDWGARPRSFAAPRIHTDHISHGLTRTLTDQDWPRTDTDTHGSGSAADRHGKARIKISHGWTRRSTDQHSVDDWTGPAWFARLSERVPAQWPIRAVRAESRWSRPARCTKNAVEACDRAWGWGPHAAFGRR